MPARPGYYRDYYRANREKKRAQYAEWCRRNPERAKEISRKSTAKRVASGKAKANAKRWENRNREKVMWRAAKRRAATNGIEFDIAPEDIVIPECCPIMGMKIETNSGVRMNPCGPSIDRIDPTKGYVRGNVWVISWQANRMKSDATLAELKAFCEGALRALY